MADGTRDDTIGPRSVGLSRYRSLERLASPIEVDGGIGVVWPDHPHLMLAPDVLLAHDGRLVAVFVPTKSELRKPSDVARRLAISRLALPPNLRTALVGDAATVESLRRDFDLVLLDRSSTAEALREFVVSSDEPTNPIPLEIRDKVWSRYWNIVSGTVDDRTSNFGPDDEHAGRAGPAPWNVELLDGFLMLNLQDAPTQGAAHARLRRAVTYGFDRDFAIDNGVPYPVHALPVHNVAGSSILERNAFDMTKPRRAAAFAGWSFDRGTR